MYPEFAERCAADLLHDLTYNLRDGFVDPDDATDTIAPAITLPSIVEETDDDDDDDDEVDESDVNEDDEAGGGRQQDTSTMCVESTDDDDGDASDGSDELNACTTANSVSRSSTVPLLANQAQLPTSAAAAGLDHRFA